MNVEVLHMYDNKTLLPQGAQKVRPARPQRVKGRRVAFLTRPSRAAKTARFPSGVRGGSERCENNAGGPFERPAR